MLTHKAVPSSLSQTILGTTFPAEEYTGVYQTLPDWTHIYGELFGFSKAEKKGSTHLSLPRKVLITKESFLQREMKWRFHCCPQ